MQKEIFDQVNRVIAEVADAEIVNFHLEITVKKGTVTASLYELTEVELGSKKQEK